MPNPKTGTTWAPDIRPENIGEIIEEAQDGAIARYSAVDHHPILQGILNKAAFFRTHVGAIWYNFSERKTLLTKLNEQDEAINALNAKIYYVEYEVQTTANSVSPLGYYGDIGIVKGSDIPISCQLFGTSNNFGYTTLGSTRGIAYVYTSNPGKYYIRVTYIKNN